MVDDYDEHEARREGIASARLGLSVKLPEDAPVRKGPPMTLLLGHTVHFDYVNHRGEDRRRTVIVTGISFGVAPGYYEEPTFTLDGFCQGHKKRRSFDISKLRNFEVER
jgi:hypothetical protein